MSSKRTYGDRCGIARALDLVGERWALLIIRELLLGPKRFTDLREGLSHVGPDVLTQRLRELEQADVLYQRKLPPPAAANVYELTPWGRELEPVVLGLGRWGSRSPVPGGESVLGVDSAVLALKTLFDATAADGLDAHYELRLGEQPFELRVRGNSFAVSRASVADPDATIETDPATLSAVLWHGRKLASAERSGEIRLRGDRGLVKRLLQLFPLPQRPRETSGAE